MPTIEYRGRAVNLSSDPATADLQLLRWDKIYDAEEAKAQKPPEPPAPPPVQPPEVPEKKADVTPYTEEQETSQQVNNNKEVPENIKPSTPKTQVDEVINIIENYDWTYSINKKSQANEIPYVQIKEFKLAGNSYMTSLMSSALLFPDVIKAQSQLVPDSFAQKIQGAFKDNKFADFIQSNTPNLAGKITDNAKSFATWAVDQVKSVDKTADEWSRFNNAADLKDMYAYLYIRKSTGRTYKFPYFDNAFFGINNSYNDAFNPETAYQGVFKNLSETITKAANLLNVASLTEPGMYIQRPQFYKFGDSEYTASVDFFLYNTITENSFIKNLDLITKLIIQNTPHRFDRLLVDPPCVYELTIPGRGFYPYTYISNLQVTFEGTRRILKANGRDVIIPDAYKVHIEFKSLTSEVNNFFIPEMGSAGIDVSKRYGTAQSFSNPPDFNLSKPTADAPIAQKSPEVLGPPIPEPKQSFPPDRPITHTAISPNAYGNLGGVH